MSNEEYTNAFRILNRLNSTDSASEPTSSLKQPSNDYQLIKHPIINVFGNATNILIITYLANENREHTRKEIEQAISNHKEALKELYPPSRKKGTIEFVDDPRVRVIRGGRESVNFWLDELTNQGSLDKRVSKPVTFKLNKKILQVLISLKKDEKMSSQNEIPTNIEGSRKSEKHENSHGPALAS